MGRMDLGLPPTPTPSFPIGANSREHGGNDYSRIKACLVTDMCAIIELWLAHPNSPNADEPPSLVRSVQY